MCSCTAACSNNVLIVFVPTCNSAETLKAIWPFGLIPRIMLKYRGKTRTKPELPFVFACRTRLPQKRAPINLSALTNQPDDSSGLSTAAQTSITAHQSAMPPTVAHGQTNEEQQMGRGGHFGPTALDPGSSQRVGGVQGGVQATPQGVPRQ